MTQTTTFDSVISKEKTEQNKAIIKRFLGNATIVNLKNGKIKLKPYGKKTGKVISVKIKYPRLVEMDYYKSLRDKVDLLADAVKRILIPSIPRLVTIYKNTTGFDSAEIFDESTFTRELNATIDAAAEQVSFAFSEDASERVAVRYATAVDKNNASQLNKITSSLVGINLFTSESWLETVADVWINNNVNLITSIPEQYFLQVEFMIKESIAQGRTIEEIQAEIQRTVAFNKRDREKKNGMPGRIINPYARSELIARDQIGKFFGQLNQYRQQSVGIESFIWDAVDDMRTRPEHAARDGKIYSWAKGDNGVYPGSEYQCRCIGLPVFDGF